MISKFMGSSVLCELFKQEQNNIDISIAKYREMNLMIVSNLMISTTEFSRKFHPCFEDFWLLIMDFC